jgi:hypothetical protein
MKSRKLLQFSLVAFVNMLMIAHFASAAEQTTSNGGKLYFGAIGNHDGIKVEVYENYIKIIKSVGTSRRVWELDWYQQSVLVISQNDNQMGAKQTQRLTSQDTSTYYDQLRTMRDLIAYVEVPMSYTWGVFGTDPLNLALNPLIHRLDALIAEEGPLNPNCVIFSSNPEESTNITAGTVGEQPFDVIGAWVRAGYVLIMSPFPNFALSQEGKPVQVSNWHGRDETYDFRQIFPYQKFSSYACRPDIH